MTRSYTYLQASLCTNYKSHNVKKINPQEPERSSMFHSNVIKKEKISYFFPLLISLYTIPYKSRPTLAHRFATDLRKLLLLPARAISHSAFSAGFLPINSLLRAIVARNESTLKWNSVWSAFFLFNTKPS